MRFWWRLRTRRIVGVEAAEVKERKRLAVNGVALSIVAQLAAVEVPVGDVVLRVAHDRVVADKAGGEIEPALIDEVPVHGIDATVAAQAIRPPVQQLVYLGAGGERDVAEVVDPGDHDVDLAGPLPVGRDRLAVVGRQHKAVLEREPLELLERAEHLDVGVQVGDRPLHLAHQMTQQPGLDRG